MVHVTVAAVPSAAGCALTPLTKVPDVVGGACRPRRAESTAALASMSDAVANSGYFGVVALVYTALPFFE